MNLCCKKSFKRCNIFASCSFDWRSAFCIGSSQTFHVSQVKFSGHLLQEYCAGLRHPMSPNGACHAFFLHLFTIDVHVQYSFFCLYLNIFLKFIHSFFFLNWSNVHNISAELLFFYYWTFCPKTEVTQSRSFFESSFTAFFNFLNWSNFHNLAAELLFFLLLDISFKDWLVELLNLAHFY